MLLWYGRWLRRQRRAADSRAPLRSARDTFDALAFPALAEKARQEWGGSGETSLRRTAEAWDQLTPQELQIARLAANGLSNRENRAATVHLAPDRWLPPPPDLPQAPDHLPQPAQHSLAWPGLTARVLRELLVPHAIPSRDAAPDSRLLSMMSGARTGIGAELMICAHSAAGSASKRRANNRRSVVGMPRSAG